MYRIVDIEPVGAFRKYGKAILSIENGDTLVRLAKQRLVNTKADFETEEKVLDYLDMSFKGQDEVVSILPDQGDWLYKRLIYERVLSTQVIDETGLKSFKVNNFPRIHAIELFRQAIVQRERLHVMTGYAAYAKNHTVRSPNGEMTLSNDILMFKATETSVPSNVGSVELVRDGYGFRKYQVYRSFDHKLIATIEEESGPYTISIDTEFDKGTHSFVPEGFNPSDMLQLSLKYLTDAGYL